MNNFDNLKRSYIETIHLGMSLGAKYSEAKYGNDLTHKFCELLVESSDYSEKDKRQMKQELKQVKEVLSAEIEASYKDN